MSSASQTDRVFQALASRPRRRMLDLVRRHPGCSVNELTAHFRISRIAVMKHLDILVGARLVVSRKEGRTRELYFNAAPIQMIYERWTDEYSSWWATQAVDLKRQVESAAAGSRKNRTSPIRQKPRPGGAKSTTRSSGSKRKRKVA